VLQNVRDATNAPFRQPQKRNDYNMLLSKFVKCFGVFSHKAISIKGVFKTLKAEMSTQDAARS